MSKPVIATLVAAATATGTCVLSLLFGHPTTALVYGMSAVAFGLSTWGQRYPAAVRRLTRHVRRGNERREG